MRQLNCNLSGKITAPPVLLIDNGHRFNMVLRSPETGQPSTTRGYFLIPDDEPPWGFYVLWANQSVRGVMQPPSWSWELTQSELQITPPTMVLAFPAASLPPVHPVGRNWVTSDGRLHRRLGMTGFCDFQVFLDRGEAGVGPVWQQAKDLGANERRVLGHMHFITEFGPHTHGGRWFDELPAFFALAAQYGLRIAFDCFADMQALPFSDAQMLETWRRVVDICRGKTNVFLGLGNEAQKNGFDPSKFPAPDYPASQGSSLADTAPPMPGWGDRRWHGRRDWPKYQESAGDMGYVSMGLTLVNGNWISNGPEAPATHDEPLGFAEVEIPNRRSTNPEVARRIALDGFAHGGGVYYHAEDAIYSRLLGPIQLVCGRAFYGVFQ